MLLVPSNPFLHKKQYFQYLMKSISGRPWHAVNFFALKSNTGQRQNRSPSSGAFLAPLD
jgi:hypothetical protein